MTAHALTIDLEDWHQLVHRRATGTTPEPSAHVIDATKRALDLLDETGTRATFFAVGMVAAAYPDLIREVAARGHEIGSHSYAHRLIFTMSHDEFRDDLMDARKLLQDLSGQSVAGFRAPEFSVSRLGHWCFDILRETGFLYDSSVFPLPRTRYGIADAPRTPFRMATSAGELWEFPLATWDRWSTRLPVAGGTYFRLLPSRLLSSAMQSIDAGGGTAVLYFHPYEFSDQRLYLRDLTMRQMLRPSYLRLLALHNFATPLIVRRLRPLLERFSFVTLGERFAALQREQHSSSKEHTHA